MAAVVGIKIVVAWQPSPLTSSWHDGDWRRGSAETDRPTRNESCFSRLPFVSLVGSHASSVSLLEAYLDLKHYCTGARSRLACMENEKEGFPAIALSEVS